jgi:hypothetical protein
MVGTTDGRGACGPVRRAVAPSEGAGAPGNGEIRTEAPETAAERTEPAAESELAPFDGEAPSRRSGLEAEELAGSSTTIGRRAEERARIALPAPAAGGYVAASPARPERGELIALGVLVVAALALRLALIDRSLWFDELIAVLKARESFATMLDGLADDVHPPLYYAPLRGWVEIAGTSALAMRAPSIAWSLVTVVATWGWSREAFPRYSPLPAAALAAFAPFAVWYATEARPYAQVLALSALAGWAAWRLLARGPTVRGVAALAVCCAALVYSHYFAGLFVVALASVAIALLCTRPAQRAAAAWTLACVVAAAAALLAWVAFVYEHRTDTAPDPTHYPVPDVYSVFIAGLEMTLGFHSFGVMGRLAALWPLLGLLAIFLVARTAHVHWRAGGVLAMAALPAAVLVGFSVLGPRSVFDPRFLAVCTVPLYLLIGRLCAGLPGSSALRGAVGAGVVSMAIAAAVWQNASLGNPKLYDYAGAVSWINERADRGDAVLLLPNFSVAGVVGDPVFDYYRLRPGVRAIDTRTVGQRSGPSTRGGLEAAWASVQRARPGRVFVIDAFAEHERGREAADTATAFLRPRARLVDRVPLANATISVYTPSVRGPS